VTTYLVTIRHRKAKITATVDIYATNDAEAKDQAEDYAFFNGSDVLSVTPYEGSN